MEETIYCEGGEPLEQVAQFKARLDGAFNKLVQWKMSLPLGREDGTRWSQRFLLNQTILCFYDLPFLWITFLHAAELPSEINNSDSTWAKGRFCSFFLLADSSSVIFLSTWFLTFLGISTKYQYTTKKLLIKLCSAVKKFTLALHGAIHLGNQHHYSNISLMSSGWTGEIAKQGCPSAVLFCWRSGAHIQTLADMAEKELRN